MMKIKFLFLVFALLAGFSSTHIAYAKSTEQTQNSHQTVVLDMQNMTCAMCKITIRKALQAVDGVQTVNVDSASKTASVVFDPKQTNIAALIKATTNAGYPATVHQ